ncbi:MAG: hypothetical protein M0Z31_06160, partial [Clostridia bacterium]|nr:hypothetical protein [Clostridia bacterium]
IVSEAWKIGLMRNMIPMATSSLKPNGAFTFISTIINITQQPIEWRTEPSIWKNIVAWADTSDDIQNVYIYDLKNAIKKKITNYTSDMKISNVLVTDGWVVHSYFNTVDSTKQFIAYNLKTGKIQKLPHLPGTKTRIKVDKFDGGSLVWKRTDNQQVVIYDLNSNEAEEMGMFENTTLFEKTIIGYDDGDKKIKVKKPKKNKDKKIKEEKSIVPDVIYEPGL